MTDILTTDFNRLKSGTMWYSSNAVVMNDIIATDFNRLKIK
ncbi:hypothetical protein VB796_21300 [Arcicella sp. LKC2W]|nr:hypothetical protein [Arcicella sp. LKC2W]MEA5461618.1 hypothetical protein [Arcicella sp. LKC2W]